MIHFLMEIDMYCNQYLISKRILQYYNTTINPSLTILYNLKKKKNLLYLLFKIY